MFEYFLLPLVFSVGMILLLLPQAQRLGLVDAPCVRKRHKGQIPLIGGLALYCALAPFAVFHPDWKAQCGNLLVGLGLFLLAVGLADDRWDISARTRFAVEIVCALVAIYFCNVRLTDIGSLMPGVGGTLVWLSVPLTVVGMVGVINAVNMTDGVDGLAGGLATLTFGALAYLALPINSAVAHQLVMLVAVMTGFMFFNSRFFGRSSAAIFLGDGGSIFIGFALAWYLISLSQGEGAAFKPVDALWLIAVPLLDTGTIMLRRVLQGRSPFSADREHLHHILMLAGFSPKHTVLIILGLHSACLLFAVASARTHATDWVVFWLFLGLAGAYFLAMSYAWQVMKRIKHFREWAGFEDRRRESNTGIGRAPSIERRQARNPQQHPGTTGVSAVREPATAAAAAENPGSAP